MYVALSVVGVVGHVQHFIQNAGWPFFRFQAGRVLEVLFLFVVVWAVVFVVVAVLAAFIYNLVAESVGGVAVSLGPGREPANTRDSGPA